MYTDLKLEEPWEDVKEKLKEINLELTDEDLQYEPGNAQALIDHLSSKMGRSPEDIKGWIESVSFNEGKAS